MKNTLHSRTFTARLSQPFLGKAIFSLLLAVPVLGPPFAAADVTWGNTGTDFNDGASWIGGIAPNATNYAVFSGAAVTNPDVTANLTLPGLKFAGASASGYTLSSANGSTLTLTSQALTVSNTSGTNTISAGLIFSGNVSRTIVQGTGGTLNLTGGISATANTNALTRFIGTINLSGTNTLNSAGTITSGGLNVEAGTTSVTGGTTTMNIGTNGMAVSGTGSGSAAVTVSGGTLNLAVASAVSGAFITVTNGASAPGGSMTVSGGAVNINQNAGFVLGSGTGSGTLSVDSGTITVNQGTIATTTNGVDTRYIFMSRDGSTSAGQINLGNGVGSNGVLATDRIFAKDGSSTAGSGGTASFVFNGGTLKALGANSDWLQSTASGTSNTNALALTSVTTTAVSTIDANSYAVGINSAVSGAGGFTIKDSSGTGTGVVTLGGANGYTGNTTVHAGTLKLNLSGSIASSANIIVGDAGSTGTHLNVTTKTGGLTVGLGQTLSGIGQIDGNTTILGTHAPGNSPGLQTFSGNLAYSTDSMLNWELAANASTDIGAIRGVFFDAMDVLSPGALSIANGVTSNLIFNGAGSSVDWNNVFWDSNHSWQVYGDANAPTLSSGAIFDILNVSTDSLGTRRSPAALSRGTKWAMMSSSNSPWRPSPSP